MPDEQDEQPEIEAVPKAPPMAAVSSSRGFFTSWH